MDPSQSKNVLFESTHWSVVLRARDEDEEAREALEQLCHSYWYPLYAFARRSGKSPDDAADITQGFFAQLVERQGLSKIAPEKGRFRTFLLASLKNFIRNDWRHNATLKRGGGVSTYSLSDQDMESRYQDCAVDSSTAEDEFERDWVESLLAAVIARLRSDYEKAGRIELFNVLNAYLVAGEARLPQSDLAAQLGLSVPAVKMSIYRMRKRYAELVRAEIAATVSSPEDIDDELNRLIGNSV